MFLIRLQFATFATAIKLHITAGAGYSSEKLLATVQMMQTRTGSIGFTIYCPAISPGQVAFLILSLPIAVGMRQSSDNVSACGRAGPTCLDDAEARRTLRVPQAELELQVPARDALADAVLRAGALLPDELQLLADGAAVLALLVAVPLVGVVLSRARSALRRAAGAAVPLHVAPGRTLVTQQLARCPWIVMEILGGRVILDGPLDRNVQELATGKKKSLPFSSEEHHDHKEACTSMSL